MAAGLAGSQHVLLRITAFVRQGAGARGVPIARADSGQGQCWQKEQDALYHVDGVAAIHSQKIGNAIRTIDTWYEGAEELGPIAVEPYGSVTTKARPTASPSKAGLLHPAGQLAAERTRCRP